MSALGVSVRKEFRAVWPAWAVCAAALVAVSVSGTRQFLDLGLMVCFVGAVAIPALAIGHEYMHGTLPLLLSLPVERRQLLLAKLVAVVPMLIALVAIALTVVAGRPFFFEHHGNAMILSASILCALVAAPWLTMLCRSPLAGTVFAIGVIGQLHMVVNVTSGFIYGWGDDAPGRAAFTFAFQFWGLLGLTAFIAVASYRMFLGLEAGDGRFPTVALPRWRRAEAAAAKPAPARRQRPLWLLVKKELRLQQMSLAVACLYVPTWIAFSGTDDPTETRAALAAIYGALLALLIGSLASAEERQMGTLEWQALLPMAAWQQWAVKAGLALTLAVVLTFGLPLLLSAEGLGMNAWYAGLVVFLTAGSLYVSSLSDSGARAFVVSTPVMLVATLLVFRVAFGPSTTPPVFSQALVMCILSGLALWFAFENHRSAGRDRRRVAWQVLVMAAIPLLAAMIRMS